jgi:hypothetical protein
MLLLSRPLRSGISSISRLIWLGNVTDTGASGSGNVTRVSSISVTRITPGIGSSTTSITAVSTADDASCVCGLTPFRLVTRFRGFFAASVFTVFLDFLPTARLTDFLPG